jgi:hypothetical protein
MENTLMPSVIQHAQTNEWPPGLWLLDPILLGSEDGNIVVKRQPTDGAIYCDVPLRMILSGEESESATDINHLLFNHMRHDAHFPVAAVLQNETSYCCWKFMLELRFDAPYYSTPTIYCGKPQIRMHEVYKRAIALQAMLPDHYSTTFIDEYLARRAAYANSVDGENTS